MSGSQSMTMRKRQAALKERVLKSDRKARLSGKPRRTDLITDAELHLKNTLLKAGVTDLLAVQAAKMMAATARAHFKGEPYVEAGYDDIAKMTKSCPKTVKRHFTKLKERKVLDASRAPCGRGNKHRWRVNAHGLESWMRAARINHTDELLAKLFCVLSHPEMPDLGTSEKGAVKGDKKGEKKGDTPICNALENKEKNFPSLYITNVAPSGSRRGPQAARGGKMNETFPQAAFVPLSDVPDAGDRSGEALEGPPRWPEPGSLSSRALTALRDRLLADGRADRAQIITDRFLTPTHGGYPCATL